MLKLNFLFLFALILATNACEVGWFQYKNDKCILIYDILSTYEESVEYCKTAFGANLLSISSQSEQKFWTFHLFRYLNTTENIWLQKKDRNTISLSNIENDVESDKCQVIRSLKGADNRLSSVGDIITQDCYLFGSTVCETDSKPKSNKSKPIEKFDPNSDFIPNRKIKLMNGNETEIFTGLYYNIISKYGNQILMNEIIGSGKCSLDTNYESGECETYYRDNGTDVGVSDSKYYMFTQPNGRELRIRRLNSIKQIVRMSNQGLQTIECYKDGYPSNLCDFSLTAHKMNAFWKLNQPSDQMEDLYQIRTNDENSAIGVTEFRNNSVVSKGFGLYNQISARNELNDRILFRLEPHNYTFNVQLYSIEWDKSLEDIIANNKKQISLIDTAIINNNSPANLNHEVSNEKQFTESFLTSFGTSTKFLETFTTKEDLSLSDSKSKSSRKAFTKTASEAISSSFTQSLAKMSSRSSSSSSSSGENSSGGASFSLFGLLGASGSSGDSSSRSHSQQTSSGSRQESSSSRGTNRGIETSDSKSDEISDSNTKTKTISDDKTKGKEITSEESKQQTNTTNRIYRISKVVSLPPYTAVKISSYANWIDDMSLPFKLNIKFTANSWRRRTDGKGTNEWRTLDADVVQHLMEKHNFPGKVIRKGFDAVYGQITGNLKASVGLESVFSSKEINLNEEN